MLFIQKQTRERHLRLGTAGFFSLYSSRNAERSGNSTAPAGVPSYSAITCSAFLRADCCRPVATVGDGGVEVSNARQGVQIHEKGVMMNFLRVVGAMLGSCVPTTIRGRRDRVSSLCWAPTPPSRNTANQSGARNHPRGYTRTKTIIRSNRSTTRHHTTTQRQNMWRLRSGDNAFPRCKRRSSPVLQGNGASTTRTVRLPRGKDGTPRMHATF